MRVFDFSCFFTIIFSIIVFTIDSIAGTYLIEPIDYNNLSMDETRIYYDLQSSSDAIWSSVAYLDIAKLLDTGS